MATSPIAESQAGALLRARPSRLALRLPMLWLAVLALLAMSLWEVRAIDAHFRAGLDHNDLIGRWLGTRAALHGADPYSPAMKRQIQAIADHDKSSAFDYPATFAVLMAPLALLSWKSASLLYLAFVIPGLALAIWVVIRLVGPSLPSRARALITLAALGSWPAMWALRLWQPSLLTVIFLFAGCFLLSRGGDVGAGILFALAAIKPQIVLPLLLVLLLWTILRRQWSFLLAFAATSIALLALAELMVPGWIPHWLASLHDYQRLCGKLPLETLFGSTGGRTVAVALGLGTVLRLWTLRHSFTPGRGAPGSLGRLEPTSLATYAYIVALLLALPVAINTTTPLMIYNDLFLLPGCVLLCTTRSTNDLGMLARRFAQLWLAWALLIVPVAIVADAFSGAAQIGEKLVFMNPLFGSAVTLFLLLNAPVRSGRVASPAVQANAQPAL